MPGAWPTRSRGSGSRLGDEVFEDHGAKIYVDKKSYLFLKGTILDYDTELLSKGFVFTNPNAKQSAVRQLVRRPPPTQADDRDSRPIVACPDANPTESVAECRTCGAGAGGRSRSVVQPIPSLGRHGDFFAFLGLPRRLNLDSQDLERRFRDLSRQFHPDYFYNAPPAERLASLERSSYLNDAFRRCATRCRGSSTCWRSKAWRQPRGRRQRHRAAQPARGSVRAERAAGRDPRAARGADLAHARAS